MNAPVVRLETDETYFRGVKHTYYHPVVEYIVDGKSYTQTAPFRTLRKTKYAIDSEMKIYYNPKKPEEMRFVGHLFPLHIGTVFLFIGAVLIWCCFL